MSSSRDPPLFPNDEIFRSSNGISKTSGNAACSLGCSNFERTVCCAFDSSSFRMQVVKDACRAL